jgi:chemotaxis protein CheD
VREYFLQPGELRLVRGPALLKTVLGSCVGITFRATRLHFAALCHPMLPEHSSRNESRGASLRRYVDCVIPEIAHEFDILGVHRDEIEVKVFGGADVLASSRASATVGAMNSATALRILKEEGFTIVASRLGGRLGVYIEFNTATGEVRLRPLAGLDQPRNSRAQGVR